MDQAIPVQYFHLTTYFKVQLKFLEFCKLCLIKTKSLLFSILMRLVIGMSKVETNTFKILRSVYCALYPMLLIVWNIWVFFSNSKRIQILKFVANRYEELVVQNLRRESHLSVTVRCFCKWKSCTHVIAIPRGGIEDTRLEAKAKDTKKSEAKAKDSLSEDKHSRGQGQECSRPRPRTKDTSASAP